MDKFESMRVFVEVAERESFAAASRELNLSAPSVTRVIANLEAGLGVRLLNRTTRRVRLTDSGIRYLSDVKRILAAVAQADEAASGNYVTPKGELTITAPVMFGQQYVAPIVAGYLAANHQVQVRALFNDRVGNLLDEGIDVAIRIGHLKDSGLYATKVGSVRKVVCGSPDYFAAHGTPETPSDLRGHEIIAATSLERSTTWQFGAGNARTSVRVSPRLRCTQNGAAIVSSKQGFGITRVLSYQVGEEFEAGTLARVLRDFEPPPVPISIVYLEGGRRSAKIRSFVDLAVEHLRANRIINDGMS